MKRIAGLFLALVLSAALVFTVSAAEPEKTENQTYSITINNNAAGHTYEAYQIFAVDLAANGQVVSNIQWGSGIKDSTSPEFQKEMGNAAQKAESLKNESDAQAFSKAISKYLGQSAASQYANGAYVISGLKAGYYLIKDKNDSLPPHDAYTQYIMKVVGDVQVKPKAGVPTMVKKVKDANDSSQEISGWQDSADYDIGDSVPFQLTATLPNNLSAYQTYKIVYHDTLSDGFTFDSQSVSVKLNEKDDVTAHFKVEVQNSNEILISCDDVKAIGAADGSVVTVEYQAVLNEKAKIGAEGNPNTAYLEYSNNPNPNGEGSTGNTPADKVKVFTYKLLINKVDEQNNPLTGAEFTLYKKYKAEFREVGKGVIQEQGTAFVWQGLDDGEYKLVETKTPAGYNTIDPILFTIKASHESESDDPLLTELMAEGKEFLVDKTKGTVSKAVINAAGLKLPSTGGIGTTVFYLVGGSLVAVSGGILLWIMKKDRKAK